MIVEFTGLPGCGKSYTASALAASLRSRGIAVWEPSYEIARAGTFSRLASKIGLAAMYCLRHPTRAYWIARALASTAQPSPRSAFSVGLNLLFTLGMYGAAVRKAGVTLLDQGIIQACASIDFDARCSLSAEALAGLPGPEGLIVVTAPIDTVKLRIAQVREGGTSRVETDPSRGLGCFDACLKRQLGVEAFLPGTKARWRLEADNSGSSEALKVTIDLITRRIIDDSTKN